MSKRNDILDDDGNVIAPPPPDSPVAQIVWLLEYGRKRGFRIGPRVQVGDTIVECQDLRQLAKEVGDKKPTYDLEPGSDMAIILGASGKEG